MLRNWVRFDVVDQDLIFDVPSSAATFSLMPLISMAAADDAALLSLVSMATMAAPVRIADEKDAVRSKCQRSGGFKRSLVVSPAMLALNARAAVRTKCRDEPQRCGRSNLAHFFSCKEGSTFIVVSLLMPRFNGVLDRLFEGIDSRNAVLAIHVVMRDGAHELVIHRVHQYPAFFQAQRSWHAASSRREGRRSRCWSQPAARSRPRFAQLMARN